ncbi:hypothetical protein GX48_05965 [Paracoccidioides brasiliensis]|nr:hypothetical protein GX48_05965 [Paracoccidioides brasiliensis]
MYLVFYQRNAEKQDKTSQSEKKKKKKEITQTLPRCRMQGINSKLNGRPIKAKVMGKARGSEKLLDRSGKRRKLIQGIPAGFNTRRPQYVWVELSVEVWGVFTEILVLFRPSTPKLMLEHPNFHRRERGHVTIENLVYHISSLRAAFVSSPQDYPYFGPVFVLVFSPNPHSSSPTPELTTDVHLQQSLHRLMYHVAIKKGEWVSSVTTIHNSYKHTDVCSFFRKKKMPMTTNTYLAKSGS